ncbi:ATP-dependent Lhr-like helicase [Actinomycetospora succinea]|uniref:ATP-dependent Lhr-like helicase n=1 Tax=Actinomycetospora succinea TaxID=663603 RepID=A0A4R6VIH3_9PSEU|nr:DEAD/DEAH box helicase [Actinomycetospora succinea]TDQ61164.1 ATP-dependent Lhr-like helicase [Actinomycetospora succinea]
MTSSLSDSAFERLARPVQKWVHSKGWTSLQDAQARAVEPIMDASSDVLITASTAGGKTEAAFLPILSALLNSRDRNEKPDGVEVLAISPLKALINDQTERLEKMCADIDVPVHAWHGDVPAGRKKRVWRDRAGVLFITPESVEGLLCLRGDAVKSLLGALRYIVVDELHAFPGSARGAQLASLLHRLDLLCRRRVPRIGLSATVGDLAIGAEFLRPGRGERVKVIKGVDQPRQRVTVLRGHLSNREAGGTSAVSHLLFRTLRGHTNLVFANRRKEVETYADRLRAECDRLRVPNEFFAHHGSLAKAEREDVEDRLKSSEPATAICTSTLEMGIDIGQVCEVAQVRCPPSVAALRQRWGRSGRLPGERSVLRTYVTEPKLGPGTEPQDALRAELVQTVAMTELFLTHDWCEPPETGGLHLSTLVQQVLSLTAQHGGVYPSQAESVLCSRGPFAVDPTTFTRLLAAMHDADLLMSSSDGLLLPAQRGEREIEDWSFLAAFESPDVFRVLAQGQEIGSIDADDTLLPGAGLVLAGRRWRVIAVHLGAGEVEVVADAAGVAPDFPPTGAARIHDRVRQEMERLCLGDVVPTYLDEGARTMLAEARAMFAQLELHRRDIVGWGRRSMIFPWRGDRVLDTVRVAMHHAGIETDREGPAIVARAPEEIVARVLERLAASAPPDPLDLAATVPVKREEKWDEVLSPTLLDQAYAARALDVDGAWRWLRSRGTRSLARPSSTSDVPVLTSPSPAALGPLVELGTTPFAIVDVETTGLASARGHRVVEIAIVACRPDGSVEDFWHTLLDPGRDVGPTWIHGLDMTDVVGAPSFADVAGDVAVRLEGRVVVAHNAPFDMGFLHAEFDRAGHPLPPVPSLCTMALADRTAPHAGRSLADACGAHGVELENAHSAREDALATAALFRAQLITLDADDLPELGISTRHLPVDWPALAPTGRSMTRTRPASRPEPSVRTWASAGETAYADALAWALEDDEVTSVELDHLIGVARVWAVGDVAAIHRQVLAGRDLPAEVHRQLEVAERTHRRTALPTSTI